MERKCRDIVNVFENCGLKVTIKASLTSANFLDVQLNLNENTYEPYQKPNSNPIYINKHSSHPPNIITDISKSIYSRLSELSSNRNVFEKICDCI